MMSLTKPNKWNIAHCLVSSLCSLPVFCLHNFFTTWPLLNTFTSMSNHGQGNVDGKEYERKADAFTLFKWPRPIYTYWTMSWSSRTSSVLTRSSCCPWKSYAAAQKWNWLSLCDNDLLTLLAMLVLVVHLHLSSLREWTEEDQEWIWF